MRRLRWKRQYQTGDPWTDARHLALAELLGTTADELAAKEHCADMDDLYGDLLDAASEMLTDAAAQRSGIVALVASRLPLAARNTPACKDCGLCDLLEQRVAVWNDPPASAGEPDQLSPARAGR
jgi:hypothetical protein